MRHNGGFRFKRVAMASVGILKDFLIPDTPLRGLIVQAPFHLCAYVGVPKAHWLSDMEDLPVRCHFGITFAGEGDGELRALDWFWYGWDYGHFTDVMSLADEFKVAPFLDIPLFKESGLDFVYKRKQWEFSEVELEVIDVAVEVMELLKRHEDAAKSVFSNMKSSNLK